MCVFVINHSITLPVLEPEDTPRKCLTTSCFLRQPNGKLLLRPVARSVSSQMLRSSVSLEVLWKPGCQWQCSLSQRRSTASCVLCPANLHVLSAPSLCLVLPTTRDQWPTVGLDNQRELWEGSGSALVTSLFPWGLHWCPGTQRGPQSVYGVKECIKHPSQPSFPSWEKIKGRAAMTSTTYFSNSEKT